MNENKIDIDDVVLLDNKLWCVLVDYSCLVSIDVETKAKRSYWIPGESSYIQSFLYRAIAKKGRKLYLVPFLGRTIMQFDVDSEQFDKIDIKFPYEDNHRGLFMAVGEYEQYLFFMAAHIPLIVRLNTDNNCMDYVVTWKENVEKLIFDADDLYFGKQTVVIDGKLYVPFCNANALLEMNCMSLETTVHNLGEEKQGYIGICYTDEALCLAPRRTGTLVKWYPATKSITHIKISDADDKKNEYIYIGCTSFSDKVLLSRVMCNANELSDARIQEMKGCYRFVKKIEKSVFFYEYDKRVIGIMDEETDSRIEITAELDYRDVDIAGYMKMDGNIVIEKEKMGLQQLLACLEK